MLTLGKTYASILQTQASMSSGPKQQNSKPPFIIEFLKLEKYFMEPDQMTLEQEIQNFLKNYSNLSKDVAKTEFQRLLTKVQNPYDP